MTCGRFIGTGIKNNNIHNELRQLASVPLLRNRRQSARNHSIQGDIPRNQYGCDDGNISVKTPMILRVQLDEERVSPINSIKNVNKPSNITFENNATFRVPDIVQIHHTEDDSIPIDKKICKEKSAPVSLYRFELFPWKIYSNKNIKSINI